MKILRLNFENINSLVGKWEIDFSHKEFIENGLFSIVGPTGSGKSSILDAITLGLYAQTPRQKSVSSKNEVMTYGTAVCYAEVTFEVDGGKYCSCFEQRRAHEKIDGQLQAPRFALYKINSDQSKESLTEKITETSKKIVELIGLNYEQFTKAVMLPQGAFSRFLTSPDDERAKILEQISGSSKYREFSKRTFEREKKERALLNSIENEIQATSLLSKEDLDTIEKKLEQKKKEEEESQKQSIQLQEAILWLNKIKEFENRYDVIKNEIATLEIKESELAPQKVLCEKARRALEVDSVFISYREKQKEIEWKKQENKENERKVDGLKVEFDELVKKRNILEENIKELKKQNETKVILWDQVKEIDFGIKEKVTLLKQKKDECKLLEESKEKKENERKSQDEIWNKECSNLEIAQKYISDNVNDESLNSELEKLIVLFDNIKDKNNIIQEKKQALKKQKEDLEKIKKNLEKLKSTLDEHNQEREKFLGQELDSLSTMLREQLKENVPCPVCGSINHPYSQTHLSNEQDHVLQKIESLKRLQEQIENERNELIKNEEKYSHSSESYEKMVLDVDSLVQDFNSSKELINHTLEKYLLSFDSIDQIELLNQKLLKKREKFEKCKSFLEAHKEKKNVYDLEKQRISDSLNHILEQLKNFDNQKNEIERDLLIQQSKRKDLFGEKSVEQDRADFEDKKKNIENQFKDVDNQKNNKERDLSSLDTLIKSSKKELIDLSIKEKELEDIFNSSLIQAGFVSKEDFVNARMNPDECRQIEKAIQKNQEELNKKKGEGESLQKSLQIEREKKLSEESLEDLNRRFSELEDQNKSIKDEIIRLRLIIEKQKENEKAKSSLQESLAKQRQRYRIWDDLNKLIGSAKGDKFSEFVQGITLRMLTVNANQHLKKLNPRYYLTPQEKDLSFQLHDNDFGEIRPTSNISGGETFQISLALALGLSSMASHRVRLDTLFLDEGFGTLDSKTLQSAISLLSNLRQEEGKLIGVITHVDSLKEEMDIKINVQPIGNGHSRIEGPGVKRG